MACMGRCKWQLCFCLCGFACRSLFTHPHSSSGWFHSAFFSSSSPTILCHRTVSIPFLWLGRNMHASVSPSCAYQPMVPDNYRPPFDHTLSTLSALPVFWPRYCASPDQCLGYVEIKLMKETVFTTTVFDHVHGQEPELKCLKWKRPSILDHAILLDPPGINYRGEAVHWAQESMSYVQRVASGRPCVFVWCMHKGHGGLASESRFVLELASRAPSCILPVVTRYNENMGPRNHPNTEKHLKKLLDESKSRDPEKADEVQRARQLYKALQKEIPLHILAQEMNEFMKKIYNTIPSQRPAAVLGLVDFQNNGQELDRALLDAFQTALQRRVVKDSDLRVVLAEIVRPLGAKHLQSHGEAHEHGSRPLRRGGAITGY